MGKVICDSTGKVWESRTFQGQGFLMYFARSRNTYNSQNTWKVDSHSTGKLWKNINMGYAFLSYIMWGINSCNSQNMGKVNYHSKEKLWENTNISKLSVSEIFRLKQKPMQFQNMGKVDLHSTEKVLWNTDTKKNYGFLTYFGWSRNP